MASILDLPTELIAKISEYCLAEPPRGVSLSSLSRTNQRLRGLSFPVFCRSIKTRYTIEDAEEQLRVLEQCGAIEYVRHLTVSIGSLFELEYIQDVCGDINRFSDISSNNAPLPLSGRAISYLHAVACLFSPHIRHLTVRSLPPGCRELTDAGITVLYLYHIDINLQTSLGVYERSFLDRLATAGQAYTWKWLSRVTLSCQSLKNAPSFFSCQVPSAWTVAETIKIVAKKSLDGLALMDDNANTHLVKIADFISRKSATKRFGIAVVFGFDVQGAHVELLPPLPILERIERLKIINFTILEGSLSLTISASPGLRKIELGDVRLKYLESDYVEGMRLDSWAGLFDCLREASPLLVRASFRRLGYSNYDRFKPELENIWPGVYELQDIRQRLCEEHNIKQGILNSLEQQDYLSLEALLEDVLDRRRREIRSKSGWRGEDDDDVVCRNIAEDLTFRPLRDIDGYEIKRRVPRLSGKKLTIH